MTLVGRRVLRYGRVASTMDVAAEFAATGEPEGLVVVADEQVSGRGRAGRAWQAPPGSALLLTVLLRPDVPADRLGVLAPLAGVALAEAVEAETGLACWLKWPNDLWLGERYAGQKAAGVLASARMLGGRPEFVLLGVGLNVSTPADALPAGATSLAGALEAEGRRRPESVGTADPVADDAPAFPDREHILAALLARLDAHYAAFVASGGRPSLDGWVARAALLWQPVAVAVGNATHRGVHAGIDGDGALLLRGPDGATERIVAGDLTRGPRSLGTSRDGNRRYAGPVQSIHAVAKDGDG